ncbi:uncharacterized protein LOC118733549 isoform X2 [Rhagoletis pomonella]|uniref:uncharacterized protein LOC118733549 isoform X2 n=1 Tax=Rhagoletis pomonella TaxID=28610 RepID=UPI00178439E7|nr:uncharacterized protein LOC118733549 isoform X2 [Rhagoletis pomonella]
MPSTHNGTGDLQKTFAYFSDTLPDGSEKNCILHTYVDKKLKTNEKEGSFHTSFFDLARRLDCNPDPYFHGSYDYYYSGGNLCILDDGEHVLHVDNNKLNNLNVGILPKFKSFAGSFLDPICSQQVDTEEEIFEVRAIQNLRKDCPNSFAVRQRNMITLYKFLPTGAAKALTRFKTSSTPFISFAQSPIDYSTFIITSMKQSIRVYDINASTPILSATHNVCKKEDIMRASWNMIRPWQGQTFLYANEKKLFMLDTRTCPEQWLKSSCGYATQDYKCDFISSIAKSEFRDLAYVATNHKLHCLDLRYLGGDIESGDGALCRWTHQLQYAPAFIDNFRFGGVELIALSSALADDICICELTRNHSAQSVDKEDSIVDESVGKRQSKKSVYKSYCLPYQPSTLEEAYQQARIAGKCLQPDADLPSRIARCTTGLTFFDTETFSECIGEEDCDTFALLLTSNSIGDVYARRLIANDTLEPDTRSKAENEGEHTMHAYANGVCQLTQPKLNCTEVVNLKGMRKVFRCNALSAPLNSEEDKRDEKEEIPPKRRGFGRWQKSIQTLHSYKDALVQDLLSIWDIEFEDDKNDMSYSRMKKGLGAKVDPENIVSSWLDTNIKAEEKPQQTQPEQLPKSATSAINQQFGSLNSTVVSMVHAPCADVTESIKMETSFHLEADFVDRNNSFLDEFMPAEHSTQLTNSVFNMPGSPTEQEEFISLKPKPKPVKKKSKYVKGF